MDNALQALTAAGSPFELETLADGRRVFRHAPSSLPALVERARKRPQGGTFLIADDRSVTRSELFDAASAISSMITRHLGPPGSQQRIAMVLPSGPDWVAALIAVSGMGTIAVLVPYDAGLEQILQRIGAAQCDLVLTDSALAEVIRRHVTCPCLRIEEVAGESSGTVLSAEVASADATAIIAFTSGSVGKPKAIFISHRALITGLWNMMLASAWTSSRNKLIERSAVPMKPSAGAQCALLLSPFTHVGGYTQILLALVMSGCLATMRRWDANLAVQMIRREGIKTVNGANAQMIRDLIRAVDTSVQFPADAFGVHGSALRRGLVDEVRKVIPSARFMTGYGLTETNGSIAATSGAELQARPDTCGPVLPTVDMEVVDDEGSPVPQGHPGEIRVRGAMVSSGCEAGGDTHAQGALHQWFHTGDIGTLAGDGFLTLLERGADSIALDGKTVFCADIEKYLDDMRVGDEVVALGVRDGRGLLIGLVASHDNVNHREVGAMLQEAFGIPGEMIALLCRRELPRTISGKIDRRALEALSLNGNS